MTAPAAGRGGAGRRGGADAGGVGGRDAVTAARPYPVTEMIILSPELPGDGVDVAARLEGLAERGGICVSRTAFNHVRNLGHRNTSHTGGAHEIHL